METIDVHLQDHIIFGYPDYLSMKDCGLLAHILKPENQVIQTEEAEQYNPKIIKMKTPFGKGQIKSTRLAFTNQNANNIKQTRLMLCFSQYRNDTVFF